MTDALVMTGLVACGVTWGAAVLAQLVLALRARRWRAAGAWWALAGAVAALAFPLVMVVEPNLRFLPSGAERAARAAMSTPAFLAALSAAWVAAAAAGVVAVSRARSAAGRGSHAGGGRR